MVRLRVAGHAPSEIAKKVGRARIHTVQVERLCLAVAIMVAADEGGPDWPFTLATSAGRALVHDALPPYIPVGQPRERFTALWLDGRSLPEIRKALSLSEAAATGLAKDAPPRWQGRQIASHFGWSPENHRLRLARGHFPTPDGRDGQSDWWWPPTVTDWAEEQGFIRCPVCRAQVIKLPQHMKAHT